MWRSVPTVIHFADDGLRLLQETVDRFAQHVIAPLAAAIDQQNAFPNELWREFGQLGLLGLTVPVAYGGSDLGYVAHCLAMESISRASASVALSYGAHSNLCMNQIALNGSEKQKQTFLPPLVRGEKIGALAMSEPNAGSDVVSMTLRAHKNEAGYLLNGSKMWITNGPDAHIIVVYAKTDPEKGAKGITAFVVESTFEGFSTGPKIDKLGMRGSNTCELMFNDCLVPHSHVLGAENDGVSVLMRGLDYERVVLSAGPTGIMLACLDTVLPYTHERKQFGQAIGEFQLIQGKIADMYTTTNAARALLYQTAQACDEKRITRHDAASAILFCAEQATQQALNAIQLLGGNGYTNDYPAGRLLRDAKLYEIGAGTSEIRRMLIGRELFKHAAH